ncbi:hypothetical protein RvY_13512 [Ramazzottius varieornatus]|uniref:Cytochrome P450 n=1 Tax=Ramazzottius varieornatus TaxID=947166 RepID=A0A1D1VS61_RAMVA|nr:hypothetical protein RvY_13512 [Ramazzottius varieornatus]
MDFIIWLLAILLTACGTTVCFEIYRRWRKYAPGPMNYPLIGALPKIVAAHGIVGPFRAWADRYGDVFSFRMGPYEAVVLNDPALIREVFNKDVVSGRPQLPIIKLRSELNGNSHGIIMAEGQHWREHRRFTLQTMRDLGMGRAGMQQKIIEEVGEFIDALKKDGLREDFDYKIPLHATVANIISRVLSGARYDKNDANFLRFVDNVQDALREDNAKFLWNILPWTRVFLRKTQKSVFRRTKEIAVFIDGVCKQKFGDVTEQALKLSNATGRDDVTVDFMERYVHTVQAKQLSSFTMNGLGLMVEDMFEAGFDTSNCTLHWAFLLMCAYPEVQKTVQLELDHIVPQNTIPSVSDNYPLPYYEATLLEVHRFASIVPTGIGHRVEKDMTINGYFVPEDTWVIANLHYVHFSEKYWSHPEVFDPSRFIDGEGKFVTSDKVMPFSVGKRRCVGEALAKAEVYMILAAVLQRFTLQINGRLDLTQTRGLVCDTQHHLINFIPR